MISRQIVAGHVEAAQVVRHEETAGPRETVITSVRKRLT
jgi:hypothetical protein